MKGLLPKLQLFVKRNSSTILTCIGAAGVVATAVLAVKETPKAQALLAKTEEEKGEKLTKLEVVKTAGPAYIPSIVMGGSTIACIFGANILNKRHQASLISAYAFLDSSYKKYRDKVKEVLGEEGHTKVVESMIDDAYEPTTDGVIDEKKNMFMDFYSLQPFESDMENVLDVEKKLNDILQSRGYVMLSEYYDMLGLATAEVDYGLGWSKAWADSIEFEHDTIERDNGDTYCIITIVNEPLPVM